jgi:hypothetical protein
MKPALLLLPLLALACSKTVEPDPSSVTPTPTTTSSPPAPSAHPTAVVTASAPAAAAGDLTWTAAPAWHVMPNPSQMRKATYSVPRAAGDPEDGDLSISQAGGGMDANIKRWSGQFDGAPPPKVTTRTVGALKVTIVETHGTFNAGGMPGMAALGPKKDWALLAAIVDATDPPYFFKLTGPAKTVAAAHDGFDATVASFQLKK